MYVKKVKRKLKTYSINFDARVTAGGRQRVVNFFSKVSAEGVRTLFDGDAGCIQDLRRAVEKISRGAGSNEKTRSGIAVAYQ